MSLQERWIASEPYFPLLGYQIEALSPDFCRMRLPFRPEFHQAGGVIHGGFIASLIDTAGVGAILSTLDQGANGGGGGGSINLTVNFLAAARGVDLTAEARVARRGRSIVFVEAQVTTPSGELIAQGMVTYKINSRAK
jgi:uncharacterized protein (TIGR00369 family)